MSKSGAYFSVIEDCWNLWVLNEETGKNEVVGSMYDIGSRWKGMKVTPELLWEMFAAAYFKVA